MIVLAVDIPYMSLQTPRGPGSGSAPPEYLSCTCPLRHLKDLEVVPHPQIVFSRKS